MAARCEPKRERTCALPANRMRKRTFGCYKLIRAGLRKALFYCGLKTKIERVDLTQSVGTSIYGSGFLRASSSLSRCVRERATRPDQNPFGAAGETRTFILYFCAQQHVPGGASCQIRSAPTISLVIACCKEPQSWHGRIDISLCLSLLRSGKTARVCTHKERLAARFLHRFCSHFH